MLFSSEETTWRNTVERFVDEEIGREYIRECDQARQYPYDAYEKVARLGWLGVLLSEELGGTGSPFRYYVHMCEMLGKYSMDFGTAFTLPMFTAATLAKYGTSEQKERYLPEFVAGRVRFSISITEPNAGSDAASLTTRASKTERGWSISGQKVFSSGAHATGNIITVAARTNPDVPKHRGISLFLVPNTAEGLTLRLLPTVARRITGTNEVFFDNVKIPDNALVGEVDQGWSYLAEHLAVERIAVSAMYVGNAQQAVDDALRYAKERHQFGRPIGQFQVIKHSLAQMQTEVTAARHLVYDAAYRFEQGLEITQAAAMAKLYASETFLRVATEGMQILGGYAQLPEFDMERYWREAKQSTVGGGTSQIQRSIIAAKMGL